jgi:hypothetical protein
MAFGNFRRGEFPASARLALSRFTLLVTLGRKPCILGYELPQTALGWYIVTPKAPEAKS